MTVTSTQLKEFLVRVLGGEFEFLDPADFDKAFSDVFGSQGAKPVEQTPAAPSPASHDAPPYLTGV